MGFGVPRFNGSWVALAVIVALAGAVRSQHLASVSYSFDEAFCWKMIGFPASEVWSRCALDNHPPIYFYLLWAWSHSFGDSPVALRSLSVLLGLATVVGAYLLVRQICRGASGTNDGGIGEPGCRSGRPRPGPLPEGEGEMPALAAAALVALSPIQIAWSQQVRMYVLGAALAVISSWLLLRAVGSVRPRWRDFAWYALAATALAYTHYFGLFVLAGQFLYAMGCALGRRGEASGASEHPRPRALPRGEGDDGPHPSPEGAEDATHVSTPPTVSLSRSQTLLAPTLFTFWVVGALWSPWLPTFLEHRRQVESLFWTGKLTWELPGTICVQIFEPLWRQPPTTVAAAALGAVLIASAAMISAGRGLRLIGLTVLATFGGAAAASLGQRHVFVTRYFLFAHAVFICGLPPLLLGAQCFGSLPGARRWRCGFMLGRVALTALVAGSSWPCARHVDWREAAARRPGFMAAMAYLAEVRQANEPVLVANPMLQITAAAHAATGSQVEAAGSATPGGPRPGRLPERGGEIPPVRVLSKGGHFPYLNGSAVMRDDEYLAPQQLAALSAERLWSVDTVNWNATFRAEPPAPWVDVFEEVFPDWRSSDTQVVVRCYKRRRSP